MIEHPVKLAVAVLGSALVFCGGLALLLMGIT